MNLSSSEFISQVKQRDHKAIEYLIESYHEALFKGALKLKLSEDQAEEVVQATWAVFFEKVDNFKEKSHIRTYLFGILYNKIKETWRSNKKYTYEYSDSEIEQLFNSEQGFSKVPQSPEAWVKHQEFVQVLDKLLQQLPENQRLAFTLKEIEQETTEDICKILGITVTNLGVLIYRAKNKLRIELEKAFEEKR